MRIPTLSVLALCAATTFAGSTNPPAPPSVVAVPTAAPAPEKPTTVDFSIPMQVIKAKSFTTENPFANLKNHWSLLFYFSPSCGHCMHTFPFIREFRSKYEKKGLSVAAIATGSAGPADIATFDKELNLDVAAFQDVTKKFSQLYGTGSVPLILLVAPNGTYKTWNASDSATLADLESNIRTSLKVK